jgi:hypothetical protein
VFLNRLRWPLRLVLPLFCFAAETAKTLTFTHLLQQKGAAIDTRLSAFYNAGRSRRTARRAMSRAR